MLLAILMMACQEDPTGLSSNNDDELNLSGAVAEITVDGLVDETDSIVGEGVDALIRHADRFFEPHRLKCATVSKDTVNKTMTIDYGDGCEGPKGRLHKGKIVITFTGVKGEEGASRQVVFDGYSINDIQIEGTRTMTHVSGSRESGTVTKNMTLAGGKLTFPDGSVFTRESSITKTFTKGETRAASSHAMSGSASGVARNGENYSVVISSPIVRSGECRESGTHIPVSGVKEITAGDNVIIIDFGDGTCDNLIQVTKNGVTTTVEVEGKKGHEGHRPPKKDGHRKQRKGDRPKGDRPEGPSPE